MSDGDDRLSPLRSIPLFGDLDDDALGRILEVATPFEVHRGHVLIQPNQAGEGMFVIERGRVTVELPSGPVEVGASSPPKRFTDSPSGATTSKRSWSHSRR
jgi:hypothetical protein